VIFIDTGAFLARFLHRDQYHDAAIRQWDELQESQRLCYTSSYVLNETYTLLARRASYAFAAARARSLQASTSLIVLRPSESDEAAALEFFEKYADQRVSFTDCISFALMKSRNINCAFTFDRHFTFAGFTVEP
jgi:predicted nucleic acid-binding protein